MNILYLCDEYPPGQHGGIGTAVQLLACQMVKMGHSVVVAGFYSLGYGGEDEFKDEGVKVYRFRRSMDVAWFAGSTGLMVRAVKRLLNDFGLTEWDIKRGLINYQAHLEMIIDKHHIEVVEMPDYNDYIRFCKSLVPFPRLSVPVIVKMHGSITYTTNFIKPVKPNVIKMEQTVLNQADAVMAVSKHVAKKTAEYLCYPADIRVLYNGINCQIQDANTTRNHKTVIYTGALLATKGAFQLAKAWNIVNATMPDARLLILGKGPKNKLTRYLCTKAYGTVQLLGHVPKDKVFDYLSRSAVAVFPSYSEAFALAPLEAMACGAAVIYTNRTSGPELIDDGIDGLLIDPDNVEQIAAAILYLLNNADVCSRLAKQGQIKVRGQFEIGNIAQQSAAFYTDVLKKVENAKLKAKN